MAILVCNNLPINDNYCNSCRNTEFNSLLEREKMKTKEEKEAMWKQKAELEKEEKEKVITFILFLMEKYDLDGIDPSSLK